jgi:hypothetical protein
MFAKGLRQTWFALVLVAAVAAVPAVAHAAPAAPARPDSDVLTAVHAWWTAWSGVLLPKSAEAKRRLDPKPGPAAEPRTVVPGRGDDGGAVLRVSGDDNWRLDPDG